MCSLQPSDVTHTQLHEWQSHVPRDHCLQIEVRLVLRILKRDLFETVPFPLGAKQFTVSYFLDQNDFGQVKTNGTATEDDGN